MIKAIAPLLILVLIVTTIGCNRKGNQNSTINSHHVQQQIHAAFYNSNGTRIALSTTSGMLIVTDDTLHVLLSTQAHTGNANSCFFSLNDKYIITGGKDRLLNVWDAADLSLFKSYKFGFNSYTSVHGYHTLGGCGENGDMYVYNIATRKLTHTCLEKEGAFHLYYVIPDSILVVCSGYNGYMYNIQTSKVLHKYSGHAGMVYCIMPANKAGKVVTACADSIVRIFDSNTEELLYKSVKLDGQLYVATFNPSDSIIAASTTNGSIYLFDATLQKQIAHIHAFNSIINTIHFSPDGSRILAGSEGGGAKIFEIPSGRLLFTL